MKRDSITFPRRWLDALMDLPDGDLRSLLSAIREYTSEEPTAPAFSGALAALWRGIAAEIDEEREQYARMAARNRANGAKGARFGHLGGRPQKTPKNPDRGFENPQKPRPGFSALEVVDGGEDMTEKPRPGFSAPEPSAPPAPPLYCKNAINKRTLSKSLSFPLLDAVEDLYAAFPRKGNLLAGKKAILDALTLECEGKTAEECQEIVDRIKRKVREYTEATRPLAERKFRRTAEAWFRDRGYLDDFGTVAEETPKEVECTAKPMIEGL